MQYFLCCSDKYTEIKMCDLDCFPKSSQIYTHILSYDRLNLATYTVPFKTIDEAPIKNSSFIYKKFHTVEELGRLKVFVRKYDL